MAKKSRNSPLLVRQSYDKRLYNCEINKIPSFYNNRRSSVSNISSLIDKSNHFLYYIKETAENVLRSHYSIPAHLLFKNSTTLKKHSWQTKNLLRERLR